MDYRGEAARPTTVESTELGMGGAVQGGEANMNTGTFHGQLSAAAARHAIIDGFQSSAATAAYHNSTAVFARQVRSVPVAVFHREPGPGVAYANIHVFCWRQPVPVGMVLVVGLQLPDGAMPIRGVMNADDLLPGGVDTVYSGDYALQPRLGAGHGQVLPVGVDAAYDDSWQRRPGPGRGEVFIGPFPDGVGMVFNRFGNFAQQTLPANLGAGHDGSGALDDDLGAVYDDHGMAAQHLRRLFAFVGIGASSVAVNGLAAGPGSPAVAFYHFALLLGGLLLGILHVLRV